MFPPVVPTSDEGELLLRFLARQRAEVVATADGLTDEQAGWTPEGGLLPIIGILHHLTRVEQRWIDGRLLGEAFLPEEPELEASGRRLAEVVAAYHVRAEQTEAIVRQARDLGVPCVGGPQPAHVLLGLERPLDLRWVLLHLIEETAHHAGHADATRELLDGRKMRS